MTIPVDLERLLEVASGFGTVPMLLTTDDSGRPRASAVTLSWDAVTTGLARIHVGKHSLANAGARPLVAVLYPAPPGQRYALLVDGEVTSVDPGPERGGVILVRATSAILHVVGQQ